MTFCRARGVREFRLPTKIVRSDQNNSKAHVGVGLKLLNDSLPSVGSLMEDDRFEPNPFKVSSNLLLDTSVSMDYENLPWERTLRLVGSIHFVLRIWIRVHCLTGLGKVL